MKKSSLAIQYAQDASATRRKRRAGPDADYNPQILLRNEIQSLINMMRRVEMEVAKDLSPADLARLLDVLGKTATRIATLIKAEGFLAEGGGGTEDAFKRMLDEIILELEQDPGDRGGGTD